MRFSRHTTVIILLGVLTLGGVVAPLTHLIYMAVSDVYAPPEAHAAPAHQSHQAHQSHHAHHTDQAHWQAPHEGHIACPYLELFATPILGDTAQPTSALANDDRTAPLPESPQVTRRAALLFSYTVRGPPTGTSHT